MQNGIAERQKYVAYTMANLSNLSGLASDTSRESLESFRPGLSNRSLRLAENIRKKGDANPFQLALNYLSNGK